MDICRERWLNSAVLKNVQSRNISILRKAFYMIGINQTLGACSNQSLAKNIFATRCWLSFLPKKRLWLFLFFISTKTILFVRFVFGWKDSLFSLHKINMSTRFMYRHDFTVSVFSENHNLDSIKRELATSLDSFGVRFTLNQVWV